MGVFSAGYGPKLIWSQSLILPKNIRYYMLLPGKVEYSNMLKYIAPTKYTVIDSFLEFIPA